MLEELKKCVKLWEERWEKLYYKEKEYINKMDDWLFKFLNY